MTKFSSSTPVRRPSAVNHGENSYKPHMLQNHISLASFLSQTVKAMLIQYRIASSESHNIRTYMYVKRAVRKAHFKLNRAFKVIQGRPYWCWQESRTVCCRNVPLMSTLFLKLTTIRQRENGKFVDFNVPARNAFEYLQMVYIARN